MIVVMHHEQPEVTMRLLVRAGAAYDPPGKAGTAALVASLLNQGTTTRSAREIADAIDSIGGALDTGAGSDVTSATVLVMKDSFDVGMNMLADVVRRPAFAPEEIERQRTQTIQNLGVSLEDPDFIARAVLNRLIYGFHPYGFPDSGMPDTIAKITRDDLREFHRRYFAPNNSILAIVGDVTADEAMAAATRVFGDWQRQAVQPPPLPEPPKPTRRIVVIDKPDSVQTAVRVGQLGIPRKTPDYMSMDQAIRILGGEGSNRLFRVLRSERGLTYSASADMNPMLLAGDIIAETDTRTEATGEAVRVDRRRVHAPAARADRRRRAGGRAGVHDGQLSADDRNAGRDRASGGERRVLRSVARRAADLPAARECRDAGRRPARGSHLHSARSPVDRAWSATRRRSRTSSARPGSAATS